MSRTSMWWRRQSLSARALLCGFIFVGLLALFYAEENWRGRRAWEICRHELTAQGVELDFEKFVPLPVPDEQNFAMTPFLKPLFAFNPAPLQPGETIWQDSPGHERALKFGAALLPQDKQGRIPPATLEDQPCDLEAALWLLRGQTGFLSEASNSFPTRAAAAEAVVAALSEYEPVLDELRAASHRPYARFNLQYDAQDPASILLPHLLVLEHISKLLQVRASAELARDKIGDAFEDLKLVIFLAESIRAEPLLASLRARTYLLTGAEQLLWEGLSAHRWTPEQLQPLQASLTQMDLVADLKRCLEAERAAFGNQLFSFVRTHKNALRLMDDSDSGIEYLLAGPDGWLYQEQAVFHRLYRDRILAGFDPGSGRMRPSVIEANRTALEAQFSRSLLRNHSAMSRLLIGSVPNIFRPVALAQNRLELAVTACAIERFRLTEGALPENLKALVPQVLVSVPLDVCNGRPLNFRLVESNTFQLAGAGWPETKPEAADLNRRSFSPGLHSSDWFWPPYPTP